LFKNNDIFLLTRRGEVFVKLICLFIPSMFASNIHINKLKVKDKKEKIKLYLMYTFLINMFIFIILNFYCKDSHILFNSDLITISFIMKFMILSLILSILLPLIYVFINKNVEIKLVRRSK